MALQMVRAVTDFFRPLASSTIFEHASQVHCDRLCAWLRGNPPTIVEISDILALVKDLLFKPAQHLQVEMVVVENSADGSRRTQLQDFRCIQRYYTAETWEQLRSATLSTDKKFVLILKTPMGLGLRSASERTMQQ